MIKIIFKIFSEPLVNFLLLGALVYIYYASVTKSATPPKQNIIKIQASEVKKIERQYAHKYKHPISHELRYAYILEEFYKRVLLEEAYKLELDKQDAKISKILLEKMHYILQNSAPFVEPTQKQLYNYYLNHIQEYSKVNKLSFTQIFLADAKDKEMKEIFEMLRMLDIPPEVGVALSEPFDGDNFFKSVSYGEVEKKFGKYFASKVFKLQSGKYSHPIHSKYGKHFVYVEDKDVSKAYPFDDVQDRVYQDFLEDNRSKVVQMAYKNILKSYSLEVLK